MRFNDQKHPCPNCAEHIQFDAKQCRFCKVQIHHEVMLTDPLPKQKASLAEQWYELFGHQYFQTYGLFRKHVEENPKSLFKKLDRSSAQTIVNAIQSTGVNAFTQCHFESQAHDAKSKNHPLSKALIYSLELIVVLVALFFYFHKTNTQPTVLTTNPSEKAEQTPTIHQPDRQVHIRNLVKSTATILSDHATGSAFFIHSDGYLITNLHVIEKVQNVIVVTQDAIKHKAKVVKQDRNLDLALIKIEGTGFDCLKIGDATTLNQGDTVWTIGAPHGLSFTVTKGVVSFVGRNIKGVAYLQADVAINPGNSGGPMINEQGEVVGVNTFIVSDAQGLNFALPINYISMGQNAFAKDILRFLGDNETMASWRDFLKSDKSELVASNTIVNQPNISSHSKTNQEVARLNNELFSLNKNHQILQNKRQNQVDQLKERFSFLQNKYYHQASASVSQEESIGHQLKEASLELLQEQLNITHDGLNYCLQARNILNQMNNSNLIESQGDQIQTQLKKINSMEKKLHESKTTITEEIIKTQSRTY